MKIVSFNVNGIRSINNKNKLGKKDDINNNVINYLINNIEPDIILLQEIKCNECNIDSLKIYNFNYIFMNTSTIKKGYSGVCILSKIKPINIFYNFENIGKYDFSFINEGRIITLEFENFYLITCYTPNSKPNLERLYERINIWEPLLRKYIKKLKKNKHVILAGDLNVAHNDIDIFTTFGHNRSPGFTIEERNEFTKLLKNCNLIDTFRFLYPNEIKYSYWSNMAKSREKNNGWRLDYFLVDKDLKDNIIESNILDDIYGSDHAPIILNINI